MLSPPSGRFPSYQKVVKPGRSALARKVILMVMPAGNWSLTGAVMKIGSAVAA